MTFDYFSRFADYVLEEHCANPANTDWTAVLSWLGDAPAQAPDCAIDVWTMLVETTLGKETRVASDDPKVVAGLRGYYDKLLTIPDKDFLRATQLPAFSSTMRALGASKFHTQKTMQCLVEGGWTPVPLMERFNALRSPLLEDYRQRQGYNVPMAETCMGSFLRTLHPLLCKGAWTPAPNAAYSMLFETYEIAFDDHPEPDTQFIRNTTVASPGQSYKALRFAQWQEALDPKHLAAMFPLSFGKENAWLFLDALVGLVLKEPQMVVGCTMALLNEHHPDLAGLVGMHCSLFPEATRDTTKVEFLVGPYLTMLDMNAPGVAPEIIDACVFEAAPL